MNKDELIKKFQNCFPVMNIIIDEGEYSGDRIKGSRIIDDYEIHYEIGISNVIIKKIKKIK